MSALEYMLLDQHSTRNSKKWVSSSAYSESSEFAKNFQFVNDLSKTFSEVYESELRRKVGASGDSDKRRQQPRAHSASQTDPVDPDKDFDWDLTDKNDSETQTRNPSSSYSDDASVQTDQRIVFRNKKVSFSSEAVIDESGQSSGVRSRHPKQSWSQTRWGDNDKDCQVKPSDFERIPRKQGWRKNHRRHPNHHFHITQTQPLITNPTNANTSKVSNNTGNNNRTVNLDGDLDLPPAIQKSSLAVLDRTKNLDLDFHKGIQTDHDPESSASFTDSYKSEIYSQDPTFFHKVDIHVIEEVSARWYKSIKKLVRHIEDVVETEPRYVERRDLIMARGIFVWVAENLVYEPSYTDTALDTIDILRDKTGARKDFVKIFTEMCQAADIKSKIITGFVKDDSYKPGDFFDKRKSVLESWVAVYIEKDWRLIDPVLGAGEYSDESGYTPALTDHYFLTEPAEFLYTHFPLTTSRTETGDYSRWQLVSSPVSLARFNRRPLLGSEFFTLGCDLLTEVGTPILAEDKTEIEIHADEYLSYKYKLFHVEEEENTSWNNFCLCAMNYENKNLATFTIAAPDVGDYFLKIFALPEEELSEEDGGVFNFLATFRISFKKVIHNVKPWPLASQPYGFTSAFPELGVTLVVKDPSVWEGDKIALTGGKKAVFKFIHNDGPILSFLHMYDHWNNELVEEVDKTGMTTLFFLSNKHPIKKEEIQTRLKKGLIKTYVTKVETKNETIFTVIAPPNVGFYKLEIYASRIPRDHGVLALPLVAILLVEVRLQFSSRGGGSGASSRRSSSTSEVSTTSTVVQRVNK